MGYKLLFTGNTLSAKALREIEAKGFSVRTVRSDLSERELIEALRGQDAYILGGVEKATANVLGNSRSVKIVAFLGTDCNAYIDVAAATANGIAVSNAPGCNSQAVAEFTIGLIIDACRRLTHLVVETKARSQMELIETVCC